MTVKNLNCPSCGAPVAGTMSNCPYCQRKIEIDEPQSKTTSGDTIGSKIDNIVNSFSSAFSAQKSPPTHDEENKDSIEFSRTIALVLCVFFGFFGVHCFYLHKHSRGVMLLIFTFTGFMIFVSIVMWISDLLSLATCTQADFERKYCNKN